MGNKAIFIDTGAWIALFFARDALHRRTQEALKRVRGQRLITTSAVLLETLDGFSSHGLRYLSVPLRQTVEASRELEVVHVDEALFGRGVGLVPIAWRQRLEPDLLPQFRCDAGARPD